MCFQQTDGRFIQSFSTLANYKKEKKKKRKCATLPEQFQDPIEKTVERDKIDTLYTHFPCLVRALQWKEVNLVVCPPTKKKVRLISDGQRLQQYQQNKLLLVTSNLWTLKNTMKCTDLNLSLQCTGTAVTASIWSRIPKGLNSKVSIGLGYLCTGDLNISSNNSYIFRKCTFQ